MGIGSASRPIRTTPLAGRTCITFAEFRKRWNVGIELRNGISPMFRPDLIHVLVESRLRQDLSIQSRGKPAGLI